MKRHVALVHVPLPVFGVTGLWDRRQNEKTKLSGYLDLIFFFSRLASAAKCYE